jgi:ethanolamine utilization protein EutA
VVHPRIAFGDTVDPHAVAEHIRSHLQRFDVAEGDTEVALAFRWTGAPSFARLNGLARGIVEALPRTIAQARPLFIVVDGDIALSLGALLKEEFGIASEVLALDGISLWDFDYIDLGRVRMPSFTVPVTIKSLIFSEDPRRPHRHRHSHDHGHSHGQSHTHTHDHGHDHAHAHSHTHDHEHGHTHDHAHHPGGHHHHHDDRG